MRRRLAILVVAVVAGVLLGTTAADAHPLGNFSLNHLSEVRVSDDRVDVRYTLDQAEIPTVRERGDSPATVLGRKRAEVARGLRLTVDGRPVPLKLAPGGRIAFPDGQGGLHTTRVELTLSAGVSKPKRVELRDNTYPGRLGWKAIVAHPGDGTAVRSSVPSEDITRGLHAYPQDLLKSPLDQRSASFSVKPGDGTLVAPRAEGGGEVTTRRDGGDGFAGLFDDAASGQGVLLLLLLAAFGWGAVHALSPGHGKAMVAAYLVGTRGSARHAVALGATVTVTHTIGVFALGFVTLGLSQWVLPEDLYPWLTLVSGLLVLGVGLGVLRSRLRARSHSHSHHHHDMPEGGWKGVIAMGASAGLIPCPSALVVLLGAIAQHEVGLGMLLIVAFSIGLAATLTGLGLAVVYARQRLSTRVNWSGRLVRVLPAASAAAIVIVGCVLTIQAVPAVL
jgi:ABC-type nickel/cobalt efflux system permease component RcnA